MRLLFILLIALSHHVFADKPGWVVNQKDIINRTKDWSYAQSQPKWQSPVFKSPEKKSKSKKKSEPPACIGTDLNIIPIGYEALGMMKDEQTFAIVSQSQKPCWLQSPISLDIHTQQEVIHVKRDFQPVFITQDITPITMVIRGTANVFAGDQGRKLPPIKKTTVTLNQQSFSIHKKGYDADLNFIIYQNHNLS